MTDTWEDDVLGGDTMYVGNYHASSIMNNPKNVSLTCSNSYSIGDIFVYTGDAFRNSKCLLCQVSRKKVVLIHLELAKYWCSAVEVKNAYNITKEEFLKIVGGEAMFNNFYLLLGESVK